MMTLRKIPVSNGRIPQRMSSHHLTSIITTSLFQQFMIHNFHEKAKCLEGNSEGGDIAPTYSETSLTTHRHISCHQKPDTQAYIHR